MNRINKKLQEDKKLLSIYFSAGYPNLEDTAVILEKLEENGVDMVEIGLPYSDPLADGETIQASSIKALQNGMTTQVLFNQLEDIRQTVSIPLLIMAYFNPILQYGVEEFCKKCAEIGIDGLIIPDLPIEVYTANYEEVFDRYGILNVFLITPETSDSRIRFIDEVSKGFIYTVSAANLTGFSEDFSDSQFAYFQRNHAMNLETPQIVGFGIRDSKTFEQSVKYAKGGIIGSAFIKHLTQHGVAKIGEFVADIKE